MTEAERKRRYPDRYYAIYNPETKKPVQIKGWIDTWDMEYSDSSVPALEDLYPLSKGQWDWHFQCGNSQAQINQDGSVTRYISPSLPEPTIKEKAQKALDDIKDEAPMLVAMGKSFGYRTRQYVDALNKIINDNDDTAKKLPMKPDLLTD